MTSGTSSSGTSSLTGSIGLINQYGRQIVVMVFDDICLGRRVVPLEVGGRPEKIFSNVDVFLDLEVTCDTSNFRVVGGGVGGRA